MIEQLAPNDRTELADSPTRATDQSSLARVLAGGAAIIAITHLAWLAVIGDVIPQVIVISTLAVTTAVVGLRHARIGAWTGVVVGALQTVGWLWLASPAIRHPESTADFLHSALLAVGLVVLLTATTGILRGRTMPPRGLVAGAAIVTVVAIATSGVARLASSSDPIGDADMTLVSERLAWDQSELALSTGDSIYVENRDAAHHTFTVDGTDIDVELPADRARLIRIDLSPGTYTYVCDVRGHENMVGTLIVNE
ncbi:MAG: cupredoxin domain-containing protein [Nitriliruptorales bacterium]|nr:cupredoxin domain-containing protein [Nitriliruptorales bacterium]